MPSSAVFPNVCGSLTWF